MTCEVRMPALGMTMTEGTIVKWLKGEGDEVERGEPLFEVMTDKATMEVESPGSGVLKKILVQEGQAAPVTGVIGLIGSADGAQGTTEPPVHSSEGQASASGQLADRSDDLPKDRRVEEEREVRVRASPAARRLARESGVDLRQVAGSGPGGRVDAADVVRFSGRPLFPAPGCQEPAVRGADDEILQSDSMRTAIAQRVAESARTTVPIILAIEADASSVVRLRNDAHVLLSETGGLSLDAIIAKGCALALREFPDVNSSLTPRGIVRHGHINVGVAVSLDGGLVVPVVRDADSKSLAEISREIREYTRAARENRLSPEHTEGGTFTVSNLGMTGIAWFTPTIRLPECAILGIGAISDKVVADRGRTDVRQTMLLTLTVDHRIVDGRPAGRFLARVKQFVERPYALLV